MPLAQRSYWQVLFYWKSMTSHTLQSWPSLSHGLPHQQRLLFPLQETLLLRANAAPNWVTYLWNCIRLWTPANQNSVSSKGQRRGHFSSPFAHHDVPRKVVQFCQNFLLDEPYTECFVFLNYYLLNILKTKLLFCWPWVSMPYYCVWGRYLVSCSHQLRPWNPICSSSTEPP